MAINPAQNWLRPNLGRGEGGVYKKGSMYFRALDFEEPGTRLTPGFKDASAECILMEAHGHLYF